MGSSATEQASRRAVVLDLLERLHRHKDAAYGDAWRKRGEVIAIFANMARKYDRLLVAFDEQRPAATEPLADTVADLCVYAGKYLTWIAEEYPVDLDGSGLPIAAPVVSAAIGPDALRAVFDAVLSAPTDPPGGAQEAWAAVQHTFADLEQGLMAQASPGAASRDIPSYPHKARLAWDLMQRTTWLLVYLEEMDPRSMVGLQDEVAQMDKATTQP